MKTILFILTVLLTVVSLTPEDGISIYGLPVNAPLSIVNPSLGPGIIISITDTNGLFNTVCTYVLDESGRRFFNADNNEISDSFELFNDSKFMSDMASAFSRCRAATRDSIVLLVSVEYQKMIVADSAGIIIKVFPVSTSSYGVGSIAHSNKTPPGMHRIRGKYGENEDIGTIFRFLSSTGEKAEIIQDSIDIEDDLITTRIMHLSGMEEGINRGIGIDSYERHIYIHGTPEEGLIGIPASHGCIRMRNRDVIEVFDMTGENTLIYIIQ
ncbi:MAG: L,D-transpeptidase [bacterium]